MNKKLLDAEKALLNLLSYEGCPLTAKFVIETLKLTGHKEPEIRAAFWTQRANGKIKHYKGMLVLRK